MHRTETKQGPWMHRETEDVAARPFRGDSVITSGNKIREASLCPRGKLGRPPYAPGEVREDSLCPGHGNRLSLCKFKQKPRVDEKPRPSVESQLQHKPRGKQVRWLGQDPGDSLGFRSTQMVTFQGKGAGLALRLDWHASAVIRDPQRDLERLG